MKRMMICVGLIFLSTIPLAFGELPNTTRAMKTAGFWISQHPSPDEIIMSPDAITKFNQQVLSDLKLTKDIFAVTQGFQTESLVSDFEKTLADFTDKGYYTKEGVRNDTQFLDKVKHNMHLSGVVLGVAPRYGLVVHYTDQRLLPTDDGLYAQKDDVDFDEIQNSCLDVGTPVAVVHVSADKKWYYVLSELSDGWVKREDIAIGTMDEVKMFAQGEDFVVVTKAKADLFLNEAMTEYDDYLRMGSRLPLAGIEEGKVRVHLPLADKDGKLLLKEGFMNEGDVHPRFLAYTARNIYTQAFAMLNQPYGWGDANGEQDCSRFVQMVYATVGIKLPRDSKNQAQVGQALAQFDEKASGESKIAALKTVQGASTILPMRGHIMLYLGMVDGIPYAMHETSGYKQRVGDKDVTRPLNRVVVSDLSLGEGSGKGSLLRRLNKVVELVIAGKAI